MSSISASLLGLLGREIPTDAPLVVAMDDWIENARRRRERQTKQKFQSELVANSFPNNVESPERQNFAGEQPVGRSAGQGVQKFVAH
jgi:hypothetical protein